MRGILRRNLQQASKGGAAGIINEQKSRIGRQPGRRPARDEEWAVKLTARLLAGRQERGSDARRGSVDDDSSSSDEEEQQEQSVAAGEEAAAAAEEEQRKAPAISSSSSAS